MTILVKILQLTSNGLLMESLKSLLLYAQHFVLAEYMRRIYLFIISKLIIVGTWLLAWSFNFICTQSMNQIILRSQI